MEIAKRKQSGLGVKLRICTQYHNVKYRTASPLSGRRLEMPLFGTWKCNQNVRLVFHSLNLETVISPLGGIIFIFDSLIHVIHVSANMIRWCFSKLGNSL